MLRLRLDSGINVEMATEHGGQSLEGNGESTSKDSTWGPASPVAESRVEHPGRWEGIQRELSI